jgi:hypothetical protein
MTTCPNCKGEFRVSDQHGPRACQAAREAAQVRAENLHSVTPADARWLQLRGVPVYAFHTGLDAEGRLVRSNWVEGWAAAIIDGNVGRLDGLDAELAQRLKTVWALGGKDAMYEMIAAYRKVSDP